MRALLEAALLRAWLRRGVLACLFWPVSKLFQLIIQFRLGLIMLGYTSQTRLAVPVIMVGNIFIGGTGKTPLVIWLVQQLKLAGKYPGVISRGYGASAETISEVRPDSLASEVGDEPLLIAQRTACPVMVGRDRVAAGRALLAAYPETDVIISDDGLQHYALARDVEILMFDQRGLGNGFLLPAGPLREPGTRRRDFTVLNAPLALSVAGIGEQVQRMQLIPDTLFCLALPEQKSSLQQMRGRRITAAAGIGHPERYFAMLRAAGLQFDQLALQDHHAFNSETFRAIEADIILITEKDAVKCRQIAELRDDARIWVVPVSAQLDAKFAAQILTMIAEK
ncbi:tetraacyldisaccharide 4'-kinase [Undibacterium sp.]|uniref:tetraacyldisaccharide 4'-kinase n=1 Tax=Undibacterium sp. TaxID=1914977 RepID=UPI0025E01CE1|nr:tetraacyldisaccharide 4'-kinase [Undibacterium sp.]